MKYEYVHDICKYINLFERYVKKQQLKFKYSYGIRKNILILRHDLILL